MIDPTTTAAGLVRNVLANPLDPLPRLVFADWLEESDAPSNVAWANYLRLSVELAHTPMTPARRQVIARDRAAAADLVRASLTYRADQFVEFAAAVEQLLPLRCLTLNLDGLTPAPAALNAWPEGLAREFCALPLVLDGARLTLAVPDPGDAASVTRMGQTAAREVVAVRAHRDAILAAIDRFYGEHDDFDLDPALGLSLLDLSAPAESTAGAALRREAESGPMVRVVSMLLNDALSDRVREITLQRFGPRVEVRLLRPHGRELWGGLPERLHAALVARFQLLAGLELGPVSADQHGSFKHLHRGRFFTLPVRVAPTRSGPQVTVTIPAATPPSKPTLTLNLPAA